MANRRKHVAKDDAELFDAARPGERFDDELDEMEELYDEPDDRRAAAVEGGLLGEGEPVGPWSDEDEEPNAFDAASDLDEEEEEEEEEIEDSDFEALDGGSVAGEPTDRGRRDH
jgi:hypothetical protein